MTRGPVLRCLSAGKASEVKLWIEKPENYRQIEDTFNSTSRFARLKSIQSSIAGRLLFMRFRATTGDAMGMNMISKVWSMHKLVYLIPLCMLYVGSGEVFEVFTRGTLSRNGNIKSVWELLC